MNNLKSMFIRALIWVLVFLVCLFTFRSFSNKNQRFGHVLSSHYLNQNNQMLKTPDSNNTKLIKDNAVEILKHAPLNGKALFQILASEYVADPQNFNENTLVHLRSHHPRNIRAVKMSLAIALGRSDIGAIIKETSALYGLDYKSREVCISLLYYLSLSEAVSYTHLTLPTICSV